MADPTEAEIVQRESGGKPYVGWSGVDLSTAPLDEHGFPIWPGAPGPQGWSHAAGLYQFQPGEWAHYAGPLGIKDFSPGSQKKVYDAARAAEGARPWAFSGDQPEGFYEDAQHLNVHPAPQNEATPDAILGMLMAGPVNIPEQATEQSPDQILDMLLAGPVGTPQRQGMGDGSGTEPTRPLPPVASPERPADVVSGARVPAGAGPAAQIPFGVVPYRELHLAPGADNAGSRPFASGEYLLNRDPRQGWSSEMSATVRMPDGSWSVVPGLWLDKGQPVHVNEDQAADRAADFEKRSGHRFPRFPNERAAEQFSVKREQDWQGKEPGSPVPPLYEGSESSVSHILDAMLAGPIKVGEFWRGTGKGLLEPGEELRAELPGMSAPEGVGAMIGRVPGAMIEGAVDTAVRGGEAATGEGPPLTPTEAFNTALMGVGSGVGMEGLGAGPRIGKAIEGLYRTPAQQVARAARRADSGEAEPAAAFPIALTIGADPPPPPTARQEREGAPEWTPPAGVRATAGKLDDDLYKLRQNNEADMREVHHFVEQMPKEALDPAFQQRAYADTEEGLIRQRERGANDPDMQKYFAMVRRFEDDAHRIATRIRREHPDAAAELADLPTGEEGYVHRKVIGQSGPGERLDPSTSRDIITGGGGGRSLSKRAAGTMHREPWYVLEDASGRRVFNKRRLGQPGGAEKYGDTVQSGGQTWTARPPTTAEIEAATPVRYVKNHLANTIDNWLRLRRVERNLDLLNEWKPKLAAEGLFVPEGSNTNVPPGWIHTEIPQLRGYAEPHIAHTLNDFYKGQDYDSFLAKANHFLIGSMFALPVRHQINVATHYAVGRGWDWLRSKPYLAQAIRDVSGMTPGYIQQLRAGSGLQYASVLNQNFYKTMLEKLFHDQVLDPGWEEGVAKHLGVKMADLVRAEYNWSRKALWKVNDYFLRARVLELQSKGLPLDKAIVQAEREIPNYRIPHEVMRSRAMAQALKSPTAIAFGRYTYGRFRAIAETIKDIVGPGKTGAERMDALGQAAVMAMLGFAVYPIANAALQMAIPDNLPSWLKPAGRAMQFVKGGPMGMAEGAVDLGKSLASSAGLGIDPGEKDFAQTVSSFITLAPGFSMMAQALGGTRSAFTGQPIFEPESTPMGKALQIGEWAASPVWPIGVGLDIARRGLLPGLGPSLGVKQEFQPPSGKVQKMRRGEARRREKRDPVEGLFR